MGEGVGWVRAAWGGEVVYWCGPLWLWEELAPWRGEGGWVGWAGGARLSRGGPGTLTVYCSQARCPLPGYIGCVLTSPGVAGTRVPRRGCLFPAHGPVRVGKAGQEADGGEVGGGGGGVGLRGEAARVGRGRLRRWRCGPAGCGGGGEGCGDGPRLAPFRLGRARGGGRQLGGSGVRRVEALPLSQRESFGVCWDTRNFVVCSLKMLRK